MTEPPKFDREPERTPYQGGRTPGSGKKRGISIWATAGLALFLMMIGLLVFNSWRSTPGSSQTRPGTNATQVQPQ
ncbi:hypothetical protein ASC90_20755 [Rhizobium sp. Root1220]|nr:hypothetical protein ASC90_20755 [Rhizobium sp. Root1220]